MVKKLVYVIGLIALSSTLISPANAAGKKRDSEGTPERENRVGTPKAPKVKRVQQQIFRVGAEVPADWNEDDAEAVHHRPRALFPLILNQGE